jgi:multidrug resistance protein, MATE family
MKIVTSYISGIRDQSHGESYSTILRYFVPEFITALVLVLYVIDAWWIADLKSTAIYATAGTTNSMMHFITKVAEGFSVGTTIMTGHYNGLQEYKEAGRTMVNAFWATILTGGLIAAALFFGAGWIYSIYGVPVKMVSIGVPFLRMRAIGIFFMFVFFAVIGFLRGIKKPKIPMQIFTAGAFIFLFFDYCLIFGKCGLPQMGLKGSALASVIQYGVMLIASLAYLVFDKENRKYGFHLISERMSLQRIKELFSLSWPVMLDKGTLAAVPLWLGYLINPMGVYAIASYTVIKDLERLAILPATAFAQVITFMVSNAYGSHDWEGIKSTIKKTVFLASFLVFSILFIFSFWPEYFIQFFDHKAKFTPFAAKIFPVLSVLVFCDLLQLILAGAMRGAANVKMVMWVRISICFFFFAPTAWFFSKLPIESASLKFLLVYSTFYLGSGLMSIIYIYRFRGERWQHKTI